jgi:hypothetical protein
VLGVVGTPLLLLLGTIGLPLLVVAGIGAMVLLALAALLALGVFAIKIVLPIVLVIWFVRWAWRGMRGHATPPTGDGSPAVD